MQISRRDLLAGSGSLVVTLAFARHVEAANAPADAIGKTLDPARVDGFLAIGRDGSITIYSGKVDLGTGSRAAYRQMVAEELDVAPEPIELIDGDTALTPDQGGTGGSTGISQGGVQLRQAAATARAALLALAAERLKTPVESLVVVDGKVGARDGGETLSYGALLEGRSLELKVDPKAPLKDPRLYKTVGTPMRRPDLPAKLTGRHTYLQDLKLPGMLHARVLRPPAIGASLIDFDPDSVKHIAGMVTVLRIKDFLAVVAETEWASVRALRELKARWSDWQGLPEQRDLYAHVRGSEIERVDDVAKQGDVAAALASAERVIAASYRWPIQSHASMGPSCGVADVRDDGATVWSASQSTHRYRAAFARFLGLPQERVRLIFLDGAGSYGTNGHDDAAADAALISQALKRPVRVQWMREDEHGWDPKGPPHLLELKAGIDKRGRVVAWQADAWLPAATRGLPNVPLIGPIAAGREQPVGLSTGMIGQNINPPYAVAHQAVRVHWLKTTPLRPSNIRAPGKIANSFAVESLYDELATAAGADPLAFRLAQLEDKRGREVLELAANRFGWRPKSGRAPSAGGPAIGAPTLGWGIAYVHYKLNETYVALAVEVAVEPSTGAIKVTRAVCAQDCGLMINPDTVRARVEGGIIQTLSRTLKEEVTFDRSRVTSIDWATYPILTFPEVPVIECELIQRLQEKPMGVGEAPATPVPAAVANAVFDAVGVRLREVPFTPERVKAALQAKGA